MTDAALFPHTAALSAMYQDALLALHRAPHNRREIGNPSGIGVRKNPLCGDEIRVQVLIEHGTIVDACFGGRSCSIATASASLLTDVVRGMTPQQALALVLSVDAMLHGKQSVLPDALDPLRGVAPFPARHGCATMPWVALRDALG